MKQLLKLISIMVVALFFVACSDEGDTQSFSKSGKAGNLDITYSSEKPLVVGDTQSQSKTQT